MALHLAGRGDHRALITLVETWAEHGVPTVPARLAEARSFVSLRMVDRAWVRLKDLVESSEPNIEALQIAAQMFLLRGWQNQARKVVQVGLERAPGDPLLEALAIQAAEPPPQVDDIVDDQAVSAALVRVAEQHMARGAFVRARTLLERVRRRDPEHQRTGELLWAIRGEFASTESLASMCERWAPPVAAAAPEDDHDGFEEPEHTVSARIDDLRPVPEDRSFPQLFRNLGPPDGDGDATDEDEPRGTPEVTAVRSLADTGEIDVSFSDLTDHGEDTQIARVMRKGGILQPIDTPRLTSRLTPESGFNLADFRREMGVTDLASDLQGPEDEDDSLVFRTGAEASHEAAGSGHDLSLDTRDERLAKAKQGSAEEAWAAPPSEPRARPRILGRPAAKPTAGAPEAVPSSSATDGPPHAPRPDAAGAPDGRAARPAGRVEEVRRREDPPPTPDVPDAEAGAEPYPEETEQDEYAQWQPAPPPIAWPYWLFGLSLALAFCMVLFFAMVVATAVF